MPVKCLTCGQRVDVDKPHRCKPPVVSLALTSEAVPDRMMPRSIGPLKAWLCLHPQVGPIVLLATDPSQLARDYNAVVCEI